MDFKIANYPEEHLDNQEKDLDNQEKIYNKEIKDIYKESKKNLNDLRETILLETSDRSDKMDQTDVVTEEKTDEFPNAAKNKGVFGAVEYTEQEIERKKTDDFYDKIKNKGVFGTVEYLDQEIEEKKQN